MSITLKTFQFNFPAGDFLKFTNLSESVYPSI